MLQTRKSEMAFPVVANIRKGGEKQTKKRQDGSTYQTVGKDLNEKFRVVFEPGMEEFEKKFVSIYGDTYPEVINAMIPFDLDACFEISNEAYQAGRLTFKAVNGRVVVWRDPVDGHYLVRGGEALEGGVNLDYDPYEMSAIRYQNNSGKDVVLPIKTQTRVKLFIPEMEDFVWFQLKSNSFYDSLNIRNNLQAIQEIARNATGGLVAGIRINVFRAQQEILWNSDQGPKRIKKWLIQIKIDPEWVGQMVRKMAAHTLGTGTEVMQLQAPNDAPDPEMDQDTSESEPEDGVIDGEFGDVEPEPDPEPEPELGPKKTGYTREDAEAKLSNQDEKEYDFKSRPYEPDTLKAALAKKADMIGEYDASDRQRNLLGALLNEFFQDDQKRHTVQLWLTGSSSTKDMHGAIVKAMLDWLKPSKDDSGAYIIDEVAKKELSHVLTVALIDEGQEALL